mgnify:CR=1 FL=1
MRKTHLAPKPPGRTRTGRLLIRLERPGQPDPSSFAKDKAMDDLQGNSSGLYTTVICTLA